MKKILYLILRQWYLYLASAVALFLVIDYALTLINKPINEETMTIFVASESYDLKHLKEALDKEKPSYLREINFIGVKSNTSTFDDRFKVYGTDNSDIIILPKSKIDDSTVMRYYASFSEEYISNFISEPSFYVVEEDQRNYGILVHQKGEENSLITYKSEEFDDDYYAFFIKNSVHIGELNNSSFTTAFNFVNIIKNEK